MITFIEILNFIISLLIIALTIILGFGIKNDANQRALDQAKAKEKGLEYEAPPALIKTTHFRKKLYLLLGLFIIDIITLIIITKYA